MPKPARTLVFPSPKTSQARPIRGSNMWLYDGTAVFRTPGSPGTRTPGGRFGYTFERTPAAAPPMVKIENWLACSLNIRHGSHRTPRLTVSLLLAFQESFKYSAGKVRCRLS